MERVINPDFCKELGELSNDDLKLDRNRTSFILKKKFRKLSGRKRLGLIWMILDPIVISLVYLFVFTVLRASTKVVFPWSTCAMIARFLMFLVVIISFLTIVFICKRIDSIN